MAASLASWERASASLPAHTPPTWMYGPPAAPPASNRQFDHSSSGAPDDPLEPRRQQLGAAAHGQLSPNKQTSVVRESGKPELGDDAEVAPSPTPARPVQVGVRGCVGVHDLAGGGDDLEAHDVVDW